MGDVYLSLEDSVDLILGSYSDWLEVNPSEEPWLYLDLIKLYSWSVALRNLGSPIDQERMYWDLYRSHKLWKYQLSFFQRHPLGPVVKLHRQVAGAVRSYTEANNVKEERTSS